MNNYKILNSPIVITVLLVIGLSVRIKAPDGSFSGIPPEVAVWLQSGLTPEQQATLFEAEKRRLERALAQEQLTEAEIKELELSGAFQARPTEQDIAEKLFAFSERLNKDIHDYYEANRITGARLADLLDWMVNMAEAEMYKITPKALKEFRESLRAQLLGVYEEAGAVGKELEMERKWVEDIMLNAQDFLHAIPPYPELTDIRGEAQELVDRVHKLYKTASFDARAKRIKGIQEDVAQRFSP